MKIVVLFFSVFLLFKFEYAFADEANSRDLFRSILDQNVVESVKKGTKQAEHAVHIHGKEVIEVFVNGELNITATGGEFNKTAVIASNQCIADGGIGYKFQLVEDDCVGAVVQYFLDPACTDYAGSSALNTTTVSARSDFHEGRSSRDWTIMLACRPFLYEPELSFVASGITLNGDYLWNLSHALINASYETAFIQGIQDSTLNPTLFGSYTLDDAVYVYRCVENWNKLILKARKENASDHTLAFFQERSTSYLAYYEFMAADWHIANPDGIKLSTAVQNYIDLQAWVRDSPASYIYSLVTMLPCERLWPELARRTSARQQPGKLNLYGSWITDNLEDKRRTEKLFNRLVVPAVQAGVVDMQVAVEIYLAAMACERNFFLSGGGEPFPDFAGQFEAVKSVVLAATQQ